MPRIRTIKPETWTDEKFVELSFGARLLFIGLWNFVDDQGRILYSPLRLKMLIFPADNVNILELLAELERGEMTYRYEVEGRAILAVRNFTRHQKIQHPYKSLLPGPPNGNGSQPPPLPPHSLNEGVMDGHDANDLAPSPPHSLNEPVMDGVDDFFADGNRNGNGNRNGKDLIRPPTRAELDPEDSADTLLPDLDLKPKHNAKELTIQRVTRNAFEYYVEKVTKNPKTYSLTTARKEQATTRLREIWPKLREPKEESAQNILHDVIDALAASDFHMGREEKTNGKKYCDWEIIFRSQEQFEKWLQAVDERAA